MSYDEREAALFGSSSSGSEYDTEEALSQPTTDDDCVDHVEEATVPSRPVPRRDRDQSPVTVRYDSPQRPSAGPLPCERSLCRVPSKGAGWKAPTNATLFES